MQVFTMGLPSTLLFLFLVLPSCTICQQAEPLGTEEDSTVDILRKELLDLKTLTMTKLSLMEEELRELKTENENLKSFQQLLSSNNADDSSPKADSAPASCLEIYLLGHHNSGFYIMRDRLSQLMLIVFCNFVAYPIINEIPMGVVDVKTSPIHFYAQRSEPFSVANSPIPFSRGYTNEGNAINLATGTFTAPVDGTYHFTFSGVKDPSSPNPLIVALRKGSLESLTVGKAYTDGLNNQLSLSLQATVKLVKDDKIRLVLENGTLYDTFDNHFSHFTGSLLEEDLNVPLCC